MKLIVGLGNPGKEYSNTRHNIGFQVLDNFALENDVSISKSKNNGLYTEFNYNGEKVVLLKPQSYMNLSGEVVRRYVDFYKVDIEDVLIIHDDIDLDIGTFRMRSKGSSAGHNGLKNIELHLGTQNYKRLKIGVSNNKQIDARDYVLGNFSKEEEKVLEKVKNDLMKVMKDYFNLSFEELMSKYNCIHKGD